MLAHPPDTAQITRRPALTQSLKGLVSAGPLRSLAYSAAKFSKWSAGRKQADEAASSSSGGVGGGGVDGPKRD